MTDVFISYSRGDQAVVRRLADAVKRLGYSVWWDDKLPPHLSYSDVITDKIGSAKAAIVVWSEDAAASQWVRAEADVARNQKKLIQTSIDDRTPPMPFNQIQFASIGDWHGEEDHPGWLKVRASLDALCGPPDGSAPQPARAPAGLAPPAPPAPIPAARRSPLVPLLIGLLILAVLVVGFLLLARGHRRKEAPANQVAAPAVLPAQLAELPPARTDATFTEAATLDGAAGFAEVRGGPSAEALVVGRVNRGEVFTTYPQQGDWWQVRTANGTLGYVAHAQIRLLSTAQPAATPAPLPPQTASRPARAEPPGAQPPQPGKPGGQVPQQVQNMRRLCNGGPGQGTPQCIQFHQRMRQQAMQGGYR